MSGYNIYVWDADQYSYTPSNTFFNTDTIPTHDTSTENYRLFLHTIDNFITKANQHYGEIDYGGHYLFDNHICIEPIQHELFHVYNTLIIETAIQHNLCVYHPAGDLLYDENCKLKYPVGEAERLWQQQLQNEAHRQALIDSDDTYIPDNEKDMRQLTRKIFKERLKQAGIKGVKKDDNGFLAANFGQTSLKFGLYVCPYEYTLDAYIYICVEMDCDYENSIFSSEIRLHFNAAYDIPKEHFAEDDPSEYKIPDLSKLRYEINRGVDLFVNAYPHVQTLEDLYKYALNSSNNKALQRKLKYGKVYEPVSHQFILLMAWLTKQQHYEKIKASMMKEWLQWWVDKYYYSKKIWDEKQQMKALKYPGRTIHQYCSYIEGDVEAGLQNKINENIAKVESKKPDEVLKKLEL